MRRYLKIYFAAIVAILQTVNVFAQKIENVEAVFDTDRVTVYYDLIGKEGQKFEVKLYSSHSKYSLSYVSGDVGKNVSPGKRRSIEYFITKDIPSYDGDLTFEVRATVIFSPLSLVNFKKDTNVRRGTVPKLKWRGGSTSGAFKVELLQKGLATGTLKPELDKTANWKIPVSTPLGSQFVLRVTDINSNSIVLSKQVTIKRKIPLVISIGIPVVVVGGTAAIIGLSGHHSASGNSSSSSSSSSSGLPGPPVHPATP